MLLVSTTRIIPGRAVPSFLSGRYPAVKVRKKLYVTDREKRILLNNAWCSDCRDANASFAPGYTLHADKFGIVIEGNCAKCGCAVARCGY